MRIGGLQKLTLIDFPGKLAAIVFTSGCSFCCPFCYNSELVLPKEIKKHPTISEKTVLDFLEERKGLLEGVVITGGEPTIHKDLPSFIKTIKKMEYLVKLDTNGSNPKMLKDLIDEKLIDYVAMDVKAPLNEKDYNKATGTKGILSKVKKSIEIIKNSDIDHEFRTTIVPLLHKKEDIIKIVRLISSGRKYYIQNFRSDKTISKKFGEIKPYSVEYLLEIQRAIAPFFEICQVR